MMYLESAGRAVTPAATRAPRAAARAAPVWCYRVGPAQLWLAHPFQQAPAGPIQQAVQNVLQTLRWDPIDGRQVTLAPAARQDGPSAMAVDRQPAETTLDLSLSEGAAQWLAKRDTGGLHLLQLGACVAGGLAPEPAMRQSLTVLQAYKARGGQSVFVGGEGFYWRLSSHLALPGPIAARLDPDRSAAWHAEGGEYRRARDGRAEGLWRRRRRQGAGQPDLTRENRRPADSFDPEPAFLFEPMHDLACQIELGGNRVEVAFRPFVARLARLRPWPPDGPERLAEAAVESPVPAASRLAAWFAPCDADLTMSWQVSPPLD